MLFATQILLCCEVESRRVSFAFNASATACTRARACWPNNILVTALVNGQVAPPSVVGYYCCGTRWLTFFVLVLVLVLVMVLVLQPIVNDAILSNGQE